MEQDKIIENILNAFSIVMYVCELKNHQKAEGLTAQCNLLPNDSFSITRTELLQQSFELQQSICIQE